MIKTLVLVKKVLIISILFLILSSDTHFSPRLLNIGSQKIELRLNRIDYNSKQVLGTLSVYKDNKFISKFTTLELNWKNNKIRKSCIPKGKYLINHYNSYSYPNSFIIKGTYPRSKILLHIGNYYKNTKGCILIGLKHKDINRDGQIDVQHSREAMKRLYKICKNEKSILITIT